MATTVNPGYNEPEFRPIVKETALSGQYLAQSNEVRDVTNSLAFQHITWYKKAAILALCSSRKL